MSQMPIHTDSSSESEKSPHAPRVTQVGFGWSYGLLMLVLPPLVYYMWICMRHYGGNLVCPQNLAELRALLGYVEGPSWKAIFLYGGWYLLQVLLQVYAPGETIEGSPLADGSRLKYKMNGWFSFCFTMALAGFLAWTGIVPATVFYDTFGSLLTVVSIFTFGLAFYLYFHPRLKGTPARLSGRLFYDYFMGTALNPREGGFDWKLFCEARPGLILWVLINFSMAAKQYQLDGHVTMAMLLVCAFQFFYVADYYWHEEAILTTWDIRHENFGWMLCFGDLVWVPFTYTLQTQYLVSHPHELPGWATLGIVAMNAFGYYLFRSVNLQKHRFRKYPERFIWGKKPEYIETARGTKLLVSGFWGIARHLNYTGDLIMALAWCLPCLFGNLLPYFYIIYFTILLVHRERRDHAMCAARYGKDWEKYCQKVPWRMIPGLY